MCGTINVKSNVMNKSSPLLSIITVCLNEPQLERTCESIVNQTFQDFEWIVIDGGSNEETLAVFEKYKSRMDYFVSEPDGGIYFGMNKGIRQARGEWLNFMNAGDMFAQDNVFNKIAAFINSGQKNTDVIYGNYIVSDGVNKRIVNSPETVDRECLFYTIPHHESSFMKRKLFDLYGRYDSTYIVMGDWDFYLRILTGSKCKFSKIDIPILIYDQNGKSSLNKELVFAELSKMRKVYYTQEEIFYFKQKQARQIHHMMCSKNQKLA